jgi:hypothetical protein
MVELLTLVATGTRALIGAVFGPTSVGETEYVRRLLHHVRPDMLILWDKGFDANAFLAAVAGTGAQFLGRIRANRRTPVLARLGDGSYVSVLGTVPVRIVAAEISVTCKDGTSLTSFYRLATTVTNARRYPAPATPLTPARPRPRPQRRHPGHHAPTLDRWAGQGLIHKA